jgi:sugar diacid utilization regulator
MNLELSHRQLQSLIHVSNVLNSSLDIDCVIDSIMKETISVIEAADSGILFLYEPDHQSLIAKSTYGINSEIFSDFRIQPGESMTGQTFLAEKCLFFPDRKSILETVNQTMLKPTLELIEKTNALVPFSAICAPILIKKKCIGVITVDCFKPTKLFTTEDLRLLEAISHQAAVVLERTSLYRDKEKSILLLEDLNKTISKQNMLLSRSVETHQKLADLVLHGEGIDAILRYLYQSIGNPAFLFDDIGELIAFSPDFETENMMSIIAEEIQKYISKHRTRSSERHISLTIEIKKTSLSLSIFPVGAKPDFLGFLVMITSQSLNEVDLTALEHACTVISLELVKEQAVFETKHNLKGQFIEELFSGNINEKLIQQAKHLHLDHHHAYQVVTISLDKFNNKSIDDYSKFINTRRTLIHMADSTYLSGHSLGMVVSKHDHLIILIPYHKGVSITTSIEYVKEQSRIFLTEIQNKDWGFTVSIGIGRVKSGLNNVFKSSQESLKCIQFIRNYNLPESIISYSELGAKRLLLHNSEEELIEFVFENLGPLLEYERHRKSEFMQTLLAYMNNNYKMKETANTLHVHLNTLSYRIKRIEEIIETPLSDNNPSLDVYLAVSIYELLEHKIEEHLLQKSL